MPSVSSDALQTLQIAAITLTCLTGLFGVYLVIFVLAIWSTYRQGTVSSKRLRWVTIILFVDLLIHFVARSIQFSRARLLNDSDEEFRRWTIPLTVIGNVTTTISGLLSDATLAWRFYVVFNKTKWALYFPAAWVVFNAFLCWSADPLPLVAYSRPEYYENTLLRATLDIEVAWGWSIFVLNSLMSSGIIYRIMWTQRSSDGLREGTGRNPSRYAYAIRAVIESAVVTWIGIVLIEIAMLSPTGGITTNQDVGTVMCNIIPIFFGISQSLITAHLGLVRETRGNESTGYSSTHVSQGIEMPRSMTTFKVYTDVTTVTDQDYK